METTDISFPELKNRYNRSTRFLFRRKYLQVSRERYVGTMLNDNAGIKIVASV